MPNKKESDLLYEIQIRKYQEKLPRFCNAYLDSIQETREVRTRLAYAKDICNFFSYLSKVNSLYRDMKNITVESFEKLTAFDIEEYIRNLHCYEVNGTVRSNRRPAIKRKLCAIRGLYRYLFRHNLISSDPTEKVEIPPLKETVILRMSENEVVDLMQKVENPVNLTDRMLKIHEKTAVRDIAIITLFLKTGIRVSELVGINIEDIDFETASILILRKGGKEDKVFFDAECETALLNYLSERVKITTVPGHEKAFFLSSRRRRITSRMIELLVSRYSSMVTNKHITPHKLRSTYGSMLYNASGDIYLTASCLGHKSVETTRKYYAAIDEERKRNARGLVKWD